MRVLNIHIIQNDMPRGFRSNRRVSTVRSVQYQQIQALEQIRNNQRQLYSMENKAILHDGNQTNEDLPMKDLNPNKVSSYNDYNIVDYDSPWNENFDHYSNTKVLRYIFN